MCVYLMLVMIPIFKREKYNADYQIIANNDPEYNTLFDYSIRDIQIIKDIYIAINNTNVDVCNNLPLYVLWTDSLEDPKWDKYYMNDTVYHGYNYTDLRLSYTICGFSPGIN